MDFYECLDCSDTCERCVDIAIEELICKERKIAAEDRNNYEKQDSIHCEAENFDDDNYNSSKNSKNSNDSDDSEVSQNAEYIFDHNSRCENCNHYILEDFQNDWDFNRIFSGCCYGEIIADKGYSDNCLKCDEELILSNTEKCSKCDRILFEEYQEEWDLDEIFAFEYDNIVVHKGPSDKCIDCEDELHQCQKEAILSNTEKCGMCGRILLREEQEECNLKEIFENGCQSIAARKGTSDKCFECENVKPTHKLLKTLETTQNVSN